MEKASGWDKLAQETLRNWREQSILCYDRGTWPGMRLALHKRLCHYLVSAQGSQPRRQIVLEFSFIGLVVSAKVTFRNR
jgi:hypothetical protein